MPPVEFKSDYGGKDGKIASHRFPGANTAIPTYYSYPEQLETIRQFLRDTVALNFFALIREHRGKAEEIAPLGSQDLTVAPGDLVTVDSHEMGFSFEGRLRNGKLTGAVRQGAIETPLVLERAK